MAFDDEAQRVAEGLAEQAAGEALGAVGSVGRKASRGPHQEARTIRQACAQQARQQHQRGAQGAKSASKTTPARRNSSASSHTSGPQQQHRQRGRPAQHEEDHPAREEDQVLHGKIALRPWGGGHHRAPARPATRRWPGGRCRAKVSSVSIAASLEGNQGGVRQGGRGAHGGLQRLQGARFDERECRRRRRQRDRLATGRRPRDRTAAAPTSAPATRAPPGPPNSRCSCSSRRSAPPAGLLGCRGT